ncbi:hypothetical protein [Actimicrobium sp. CCI2.3]|uniref:hypothetical protein n=1 Tax=Actimicrobium sp. CCI2.3 TaxID=3048616 RepID=UPI002AB3A5C5|nr:hypothetical protein [Actimicrobium sp. CCI2.3]MDY7574687.1 hypothetical protein [Actimicrobium sp. CCI2.3]MEB0020357.1 hypothetical protein [Actimicrobium sp. CCI2.3]
MILKKFILTLFILMALSGCIFNSGWKSHVPVDLKSFGQPNIIYLVDDTYFVGPGGINNAFVVYNLSDNALKKIQEGGLHYLQSMGSTIKYNNLWISYTNSKNRPNITPREENSDRLQYYNDTRGLFKDWQATPVTDNRWRKNDENHSHSTSCKDTSICSFYGDFVSVPPIFKYDKRLQNQTLADLNFISKIKPEYIQMVNKIIASSGSYYGYGELGFFIIAPSEHKMFLLFRA